MLDGVLHALLVPHLLGFAMFFTMLSLCEFYAHQLMITNIAIGVRLSVCRLLQQWIVFAYTKVEVARIDWVKGKTQASCGWSHCKDC